MTSENLELWLNDTLDSKLLQMYAFKTSAGIQALAETTVIIAKEKKQIRTALLSFTLSLGVAFQIIDDVHNFSNSNRWKKECGEDLKEGKLTYAIFRCLKDANTNDKEFLIDLLCNVEKRNNKEIVKQGIEIVKKSGTLEKCREEAINMVETEWDKMNKIFKSSDQKILLRVLTNYLLQLNYK